MVGVYKTKTSTAAKRTEIVEFSNLPFEFLGVYAKHRKIEKDKA
jgi:hypothetical protein